MKESKVMTHAQKTAEVNLNLDLSNGSAPPIIPKSVRVGGS